MQDEQLEFSIIYGGRSVEHDVSVSMYRNLVKQLAQTRNLKLSAVHFITKEGEYAYKKSLDSEPPSHAEMCGSQYHRSITELPNLMRDDGSFVFSFLIGRDGEDGRIQGMAEFFRLFGSFGPVDASSLGINKWAFGILAEHATAGRARAVPGALIKLPKSTEELDCIVADLTGNPCIVKPNRQGSSFGLRVLDKISSNALERYLDEFRLFDTEFLLQKRIFGRELTCGCLQDLNSVLALDVVEVVSRSHVFSYEAKWQGEPYNSVSIPDGEERRLVESVSVALMRAFSIHTMARFDFILAEDGLYILEVNTVPGMSALSIYPAMLARRGLTMLDVIRAARRNELSRTASTNVHDSAVARWSIDGFDNQSSRQDAFDGLSSGVSR